MPFSSPKAIREGVEANTASIFDRVLSISVQGEQNGPGNYWREEAKPGKTYGRTFYLSSCLCAPSQELDTH